MTARETTERGERFTTLVGAELVKAFHDRGISGRSVAALIGMHPTVLHGYTSGRRAIPLTVLIEICDAIGERPYTLVIRAYDKLGPIER